MTRIVYRIAAGGSLLVFAVSAIVFLAAVAFVPLRLSPLGGVMFGASIILAFPPTALAYFAGRPAASRRRLVLRRTGAKKVDAYWRAATRRVRMSFVAMFTTAGATGVFGIFLVGSAWGRSVFPALAFAMLAASANVLQAAALAPEKSDFG